MQLRLQNEAICGVAKCPKSITMEPAKLLKLNANSPLFSAVEPTKSMKLSGLSKLSGLENRGDPGKLMKIMNIIFLGSL